MPIITPATTRRIINERGSFVPNIRRVAATRALVEAAAVDLAQEFDVFLSHSSQDASDVFRIKLFLEALEYSVYVDWVEDGDLDRTKVDTATAKRIRTRITRSRSLVLYATPQAKGSRWVPWELGFADGRKKQVAVLPEIADEEDEEAFKGVEYVGLYPYVDVAKARGTGRETLWVRRSKKKYVSFDRWLDGEEPTNHA